jgi:hypothetical protein
MIPISTHIYNSRCRNLDLIPYKAVCVCNACFIDDGRLHRPFTKGPTAKY